MACVCSPENRWGSDDSTSEQMTGSPGGEATSLRCTAVCVLLDVVLPGGVGSFWKTVTRSSQTGIARQPLDEQVGGNAALFRVASGLNEVSRRLGMLRCSCRVDVAICRPAVH